MIYSKVEGIEQGFEQGSTIAKKKEKDSYLQGAKEGYYLGLIKAADYIHSGCKKGRVQLPIQTKEGVQYKEYSCTAITNI